MLTLDFLKLVTFLEVISVIWTREWVSLWHFRTCIHQTLIYPHYSPLIKENSRRGEKSPMKRVTVGLGPHHLLDFPTVPGRQTEQALWGLLCEGSYCAGYLMCSWAQGRSHSRVEQAGPIRGTFSADATLGRMHYNPASRSVTRTPGCTKSWICSSLPDTPGDGESLPVPLQGDHVEFHRLIKKPLL